MVLRDKIILVVYNFSFAIIKFISLVGAVSLIKETDTETIVILYCQKKR